MNLKEILSDPGLKGEVIDALMKTYIPLLKGAGQETMFSVLTLARHVIQYRAAGNEQAASSALSTIDLLLESVAIMAKHNTEDLIRTEVHELLLGTLPKLAIELSTGVKL